MKHKHADLILEWALDASKAVQYRSLNGKWEDVQHPSWATNGEYRFKPEPEPEPKPDYHTCATILNNSLQVSYVGKPNIKFTFDGETHQLKAAEVLK